MSNISKYSSKSTALRGVARMGITDKESAEKLVYKTADGKFAVDKDQVDAVLGLSDVSEEDENLILSCGHSNCPHCEIHLSNGLSDFDGMVERHGSEAKAFKDGQQHEWMCLGCNGQWGAAIEVKGTKPRGEPLRHYTNKSTIDGAVAAMWALCEEMPGARRKDVIAAAVEKGIAFYTARTQYQKWFKAKAAK